MRSIGHARHALTLALLGALASPSLAQSSAQPPAAIPVASTGAAARLSADDIATFARLSVTLSAARDSTQKQLAMARNKTPQAQSALRQQLASEIAELLHHAGLTEADFRQRTFLVSSDSAARTQFDVAVAKLTGAPLPGQLAAAAGTTKVPANAVGAQLAQIVNTFGDTPSNMGLLPTAMAEARVAALHASLGARDLSNLAAMKLHAGHVIHAVDPTVVTQGPALGYGVKRAALGVATYVNLAAKATGASQNVITHAGHIGAAARNTVQRSDDVVALAKKIQAAGTAQDAAPLMTQLVALTNELVLGKGTEGGLQLCDEHMKLLLAGENP